MTRSGVSVGLTIGVGAGASHSFKFATARPRLSVLFCLVLCFGMTNAMEDGNISNPVVNVIPTAVGTLSSTTVPSPLLAACTRCYSSLSIRRLSASLSYFCLCLCLCRFCDSLFLCLTVRSLFLYVYPLSHRPHFPFISPSFSFSRRSLVWVDRFRISVGWVRALMNTTTRARGSRLEPRW